MNTFPVYDGWLYPLTIGDIDFNSYTLKKSTLAMNRVVTGTDYESIDEFKFFIDFSIVTLHQYKFSADFIKRYIDFIDINKFIMTGNDIDSTILDEFKDIIDWEALCIYGGHISESAIEKHLNRFPSHYSLFTRNRISYQFIIRNFHSMKQDEVLLICKNASGGKFLLNLLKDHINWNCIQDSNYCPELSVFYAEYINKAI